MVLSPIPEDEEARPAAARPRAARPPRSQPRGAAPRRRRRYHWALLAVPGLACAGSLLLPRRGTALKAGFMNGERHRDAAADDRGRVLEEVDDSPTIPPTNAPSEDALDAPRRAEPKARVEACRFDGVPSARAGARMRPAQELQWLMFAQVLFAKDTPTDRLAGMAVTFASIALVMFLLKLLLAMAGSQIWSVPEYRLKRDPFQNKEKGQDWNYDFVIVTTVKDEDHVISSDMQKRNTMKRIISALENADLQTEQYKSRKFDKIFIKVRAPKERLEEQADRLNLRMRLDERQVKQRLIDGLVDPMDDDEYEIYPRRNGWVYKGANMETAITDTEEQCPYAYYEYIYGEYRRQEELEALYHKYPRSGAIFRSVDRVKLIMSIIKYPAADNGAELVLEELVENKIIVAAFPLHDISELRACQLKWLVYWAWPWDQPFTRIKDYFGEKIGLYFVFLGHYTASVMAAAFVGFIFFAITVVDGVNSPAIPAFCIFMSIWATVFLESWKRRQARFAMLWGMVDIEQAESERPAFLASELVKDINSPVDGEEMKYFPPNLKDSRSLQAWTVIIVSTTAVIAAVCVIFFLKAILAVKNNLLNTRHWNCSHNQKAGKVPAS